MNSLPLPNAWLNRPIRIDLVGVGGTGSQVLDQLASLDSLMRALGHPGFRVRIYDGDTVSRWNLGRQRFCKPDLGQFKAHVLTHRINLFYGVQYEAHAIYADPRRLGHTDLLITCTDSGRFRAEVGKAWAKQSTSTFWLDFGNGDKTAQVVLGHLGQPLEGQRVPNVFDLFPQLATINESEQGPSCSMEEAVQRQPWPANRIVAVAGMTLLERWLRTGALTFHGNLMQLEPYTVTPLNIDPVAWAMFGYATATAQADTTTRKTKRRSRQAVAA